MPACPENRYATTQASAAYTPIGAPNNSIAMIVDAIGVFAAPANTATKPSPASTGAGSASRDDSALPSVAPI
ncbi:hypothetical protein BBK_4603 [Burkholderia pseudomallei NCTC 13179]|nr:hypothetical protein BBK_4603 [Burkholderia pseudomallei NCTC 13179]